MFIFGVASWEMASQPHGQLISRFIVICLAALEPIFFSRLSLNSFFRPFFLQGPHQELSRHNKPLAKFFLVTTYAIWSYQNNNNSGESCAVGESSALMIGANQRKVLPIKGIRKRLSNQISIGYLLHSVSAGGVFSPTSFYPDWGLMYLSCLSVFR